MKGSAKEHRLRLVCQHCFIKLAARGKLGRKDCSSKQEDPVLSNDEERSGGTCTKRRLCSQRAFNWFGTKESPS